MLTFYIIDTETNGLRPGWHEISQISIIRFSDRNQLSKNIKVENPERSSQEALDITGQTRYSITQGEPKEKVVESIISFLNQDGLTPEHRCLVAHQASFDKNHCHALFQSVGEFFPAVNWLDSKPLAKQWAVKLGIEKPKLSLQAALQFTGIKPLPGIHTAVADARNLYLLFKKALEEGIDYLPHIKRYEHILE